MFEASQEAEERPGNPLVAARAKREELVPRPAITSQRLQPRNPFARKAAGAAQLSSPASSGGSLAFDTAVPAAVRPSPLPSKAAFTAAAASKIKVSTFIWILGVYGLFPSVRVTYVSFLTLIGFFFSTNHFGIW
jgi:hypothetical protein